MVGWGLGEEERRWERRRDWGSGLGVECFFETWRGMIGRVGADAGGSVGHITHATTIDLVVAWVYNPRY